MNKWIKVESNFLQDALFNQMREDDLSVDDVSRHESWRFKKEVVVHSFTQISEQEMIICWEGVDYFGERIMMNTKVNTDW